MLSFSRPIGQDFVVRYAQILNTEIVAWPESIKMEVNYEYMYIPFRLSNQIKTCDIINANLLSTKMTCVLLSSLSCLYADL